MCFYNVHIEIEGDAIKLKRNENKSKQRFVQKKVGTKPRNLNLRCAFTTPWEYYLVNLLTIASWAGNELTR